ncbi:GNAT family N-acetyltransferase [Mobilicoccus pelagius]|nr:GNAT family N-acetyltransferase [Mobilicoccus pelagius]
MRAATSADSRAVHALDTLAFAGDPTRVPPEHALSGLDLERTFLAEHPDLPDGPAGLYSSYDLRVRVPGTPAEGTRLVPVNGLTWVGVHPDVRRRGVLGTMIRHHLREARERGEAIVGLHASEPGIYGRFGYGVASHNVTYTLGRGTEITAPQTVVALADRTTTGLVTDLDDDTVAARLRDVLLDSPALGTVVLPERCWRSVLRDVPEARRGVEPRRALVATRDGRDVGAAILTRKARWEDGRPEGTVAVDLVTAVDAGALLALGRRLVDMDLTAEARFVGRGVDDPLLGWAGGIRLRRVRISDALWLRPVDVGRMLVARGYGAPLDVRLVVADPVLEENRGTWHLHVDASGKATCDRSHEAPDVSLDVAALGETFLGLVGPTALAAQGRIVEHAPGAVATLTSAFATGAAPLGGLSF